MSRDLDTDTKPSSTLPKSFPPAIAVLFMVFLPQPESSAPSSLKAPCLESNVLVEPAGKRSHNLSAMSYLRTSSSLLCSCPTHTTIRYCVAGLTLLPPRFGAVMLLGALIACLLPEVQQPDTRQSIGLEQLSDGRPQTEPNGDVEMDRSASALSHSHVRSNA